MSVALEKSWLEALEGEFEKDLLYLLNN